MPEYISRKDELKTLIDRSDKEETGYYISGLGKILCPFTAFVYSSGVMLDSYASNPDGSFLHYVPLGLVAALSLSTFFPFYRNNVKNDFKKAREANGRRHQYTDELEMLE